MMDFHESLLSALISLHRGRPYYQLRPMPQHYDWRQTEINV